MPRYDKKAKKKKARYASDPPIAKQPKFRDYPPSDANANFSWRVADKYTDYDYQKLGWCNCDSTVLLRDVIKELQSYEGLTWQEVRQKSRHNHSWKYDRLPRELKYRLKERELDYLPELYQICLACKPRIWGYKDIAQFYLIWYDPEHEGYPTSVR
ncbi:MAG: hypothetical protein PVG61_03325 [Dehalococcoidia bacterium]|jgi:hypothetical protein